MTVTTGASGRVILAPSEVDQTFVDPTRDHDLRTNGYTTFPVLDPDEVAMISRAHADMVGPGGSGMAVDYMREDRSVMARFNDLLASVWARHFEAIFVDHRPVFATCVVKYPGSDSAMFLHEDRSYVDERSARAGTLWIPLVDTGPSIDNGCLHVVPGSHRLAVAFSGSHTPDLIRPYEAALESALVPVEVPAGHGLFYDTRTLHASPPNRTAHPRPAIACAVAPRRSPLIHVVGAGARRRLVHAVDESFFIEHSPEEIERSMPDCYPVIESFDDDVDRLDPEFVRITCDLAVTPVPRVLIPGDLREVHEGRTPSRPPDTPQRAGALVVTDQEWRDDDPTTPGASIITDVPGDRWIPAPLWPTAEVAWSVGTPRLRLLDRGATAVRLAPRERLALAPVRSRRVVRTIETSAFAAGVVGAGRAEHLTVGDTLSVDAGEEVVVWNHGPGQAVAVLEATGRGGPTWARFRHWPRARAVGRVEREVQAATV